MERGAWYLTTLPPNRTLVDTKWVFRVKLRGDGTLDRFKARLCARGFTQVPGLDYDETYAPVGKYATARALLALASLQDYDIHVMDVDLAFLYSTLDEDIYMAQPEGFDDGSGRVCKIVRGLYGLKQSPRLWNRELDGKLQSWGFRPSDLDASLYVFRKAEVTCLLLVYVDDLLLMCSSSLYLAQIKRQINSAYSMKDLGEVTFYLGMNIYRDRKRKLLQIGQQK